MRHYRAPLALVVQVIGLVNLASLEGGLIYQRIQMVTVATLGADPTMKISDKMRGLKGDRAGREMIGGGMILESIQRTSSEFSI